jgi:hypothetical protein
VAAHVCDFSNGVTADAKRIVLWIAYQVRAKRSCFVTLVSLSWLAA